MTVSWIVWRLKTLLMAHIGLLAYRMVGRPRPRGYCPVCERAVREWMPFHRDVGTGKLRAEPEKRLCPFCSSFERTRHIRLWLEQHAVPSTARSSLHFAPERRLSKWFRRRATGRYITTDLMQPYVDQKEDITKMSFDAGSFDFIYCSNVLEHVPDDRKAMEELFRVLEPGGLAVLQVPIRGETTYEDNSITDPAERAKHFGQADHVRYYGRDFKDRLEAVGFQVQEVWMPDPLNLSNEELQRMNLSRKELVHFCTKEGGESRFPDSLPESNSLETR